MIGSSVGHHVRRWKGRSEMASRRKRWTAAETLEIVQAADWAVFNGFTGFAQFYGDLLREAAFSGRIDGRLYERHVGIGPWSDRDDRRNGRRRDEDV